MAQFDSTPEPLLIRSSAGIYAAAAALVVIERTLPGGPAISLAPALAALLVAGAVLLAGPRLPRPALVALTPLGTALIAYGLATSSGYTDAAILYSWPTLWVAYFYGTRATVLSVAGTAVAHAVALDAMPAGLGSVDRWIDVVVSVAIIAGVVRVLVHRRDQLVEQLRAEARKDPLTGLLNRRGLDERLEIELQRARRERRPLAAVALDIDRFKDINDEHGHETGDRVLVRVADTLRGESRASDLVARLGGDEFLAVLPAADPATARAYADRVRGALREDARTPPVAVSAGVAVTAGPSSADALAEAADAALYDAKRAGRDTTRVAV
ncbi:GGDEF domain-containing protein [Solirubrobacter sp. CPCC 204708]|uniref:GGDEF domain-containing protein n=1 Tax=Solirubrobacter deserti TaxID=2282478 RepID=A0ABT4RTZ1_9ACTN|nr:GGDEF domain-containing protein [Solirubrobacter deserti]MBE2320751.1 GGDEF domain-containing protein [Solirubrobacter deserti]MDA0141853.1 GGDEF domain-containing protein [Solirubrobacter deserti]